MQWVIRALLLLAVLRCSGEDSPAAPATPDTGDVADASGATPEVQADAQDAAADVQDAPQVDVSNPGTPCKSKADCVVGSCGLPTCISGLCGPPEPKPDGTTCDDGNVCTESDACVAGECAGAALTCDDGNACTVDACEPSGCTSTIAPGAPCDDKNPCTENDACNAQGLCKSGKNTCTEDCLNGVDDDKNQQVDCNDVACVNHPDCLGQCAAVQAVACNQSATIDLAAGPSDLQSWPCSGSKWAGPEAVVSFVEPANATVVAKLVDPGNGVTLLHVEDPDGLGCQSAMCDADGQPDITFESNGGETSYFIVETQADVFGSVELEIECIACVPSCVAKACGNDGCGGTCGTCAGGKSCSPAGLCLTPPSATCAKPEVVKALPYVKKGATTGGADTLALPPGSGCAGEPDLGLGQGTSDTVTQFTPLADGQYLIALAADFDSALYVLSTCDPGAVAESCLQAQNAGGQGGEKLIMDLKGGVPYTIVVDGLGGIASGQYTLTINDYPCIGNCAGKICGSDACEGSCGSCGVGFDCTEAGQCGLASVPDTCAEAVPVGDLPWTTDGDTSAAKDDSLTYAFFCKGTPFDPATQGPLQDQGAGAPDVAYSFTAPQNGKFRATLTPSFDGVLSIRGACVDKSATDCLAALVGSGPQAIDFVLSKGDKVFLLVDGSKKGQQGTFTLAVEALPCTPQCSGKQCGNDQCGGVCGTCGEAAQCSCAEACVAIPSNDTCETAMVIPSLPFTFEGDTGGAHDDYAMPPAVDCDGGPSGATYGTGRDVVFKYTADKPQSVTFHFDQAATPPADFNTYLYVVDDCADAAQGLCIMAADSPINGKESVVVANMKPGQTVYVIVDGWKAPNCGHFTFKATVF